jgi:hypothetical protein
MERLLILAGLMAGLMYYAKPANAASDDGQQKKQQNEPREYERDGQRAGTVKGELPRIPNKGKQPGAPKTYYRDPDGEIKKAV